MNLSNGYWRPCKQISLLKAFCYDGRMTEHLSTTPTRLVSEYIAATYANSDITIHAVEGGYSRNRRAIIEVGDTSLFAKEVDTALLPDDGAVELSWLKKDCALVNELGRLGVSVAPEWAELHLDDHLLLMPSYKKEDGWQWSLPTNDGVRTAYIQAVIDATKQLEVTILAEDLTEQLSLQPFFRDEIALYKGIAPILGDQVLRTRLLDKYTALRDDSQLLAPMHDEMRATLSSDARLKELQQRATQLAQQPNDCFNHCDVRSDNIAYNERTGEVKFVDWNWASYAPAKFGATEFLIDMARRGVDVSPWFEDMDADLLAATVGFYLIRSLKEPLAPGNTLRDMQAESAAVANHLYNKVK